MYVLQVRQTYRFTRDFCRTYLDVDGDGGFKRIQLRAVASLLGVPPGEPVQFLDRGTHETLAVIHA